MIELRADTTKLAQGLANAKRALKKFAKKHPWPSKWTPLTRCRSVRSLLPIREGVLMGRRLPTHKPLAKRDRPADPRPNATERGYGRRWRRLRALVLAGEPLCRECRSKGVIKPATDVDHIVAKAPGVAAESATIDELQPLCHECHSAKTVREDGGFGNGKS